MSQMKEYLAIALMNIRSNKGRSILTMLGIIIGISSVIMVISIGSGVSSEINSELDSLGGGQVALYVDGTRKETTVHFTAEDLDYLAEHIDHVKGCSNQVRAWGTVEGPKGSFDVMMTGGTEYQQYSSTLPISKGHYFTKSDVEASNRVCVITEQDAIHLFGNTNVIGMTLAVTESGITHDLTIVGIRENSSSSIANMVGGGGTYVEMELPVSVMSDYYYFYTDNFDLIYLYSEGNQYCSDVAKEAIALMEIKYNVRGQQQIQVESFSDYSAQFSSILGVVTLFVSFVAAISLVVGGIGVMNIMLVSVTERTREIGIRKALGARTSSIMTQFLAEAAIITLLGGVIGIVLGVLGAMGVCGALGMKASIQVATVLIACIFSSAIGIFFGIYPARKAAKLSPIEALRHE